MEHEVRTRGQALIVIIFLAAIAVMQTQAWVSAMAANVGSLYLVRVLKTAAEQGFTLSTITLAPRPASGDLSLANESVKWLRRERAITTSSLRRLARALVATGDLAGATTIQERVAGAEPGSALEQVFLGDLYYALGSPAQAMAAWRLGKGEAHLLALGRQTRGTGRVTQALVYFDLARQVAPESPKPYYALGDGLDGIGDVRGAMSAYEAGIRRDIEHSAWREMAQGYLWLHQGDVQAAVDAYTQAAVMAPRELTIRHGLVQALQALPDHYRAVAECRQILREGLGDMWTYLLLGNSLRALGQLPESLEAYRQAAVVTPGSEVPALYEGGALFASRQWTNAIDAFQRALAISPASATAHGWLGRVYLRQGRAAEAIAELQRAIALDQMTDWYYFELGLAHGNLQNWRAGADAFSQALLLNPGHAEARQALEGLRSAHPEVAR